MTSRSSRVRAAEVGVRLTWFERGYAAWERPPAARSRFAQM